MKKLTLAVVFVSLFSCVVVTNKTVNIDIHDNEGTVGVEGKNSGSEAKDALNGSLNPDIDVPLVP